MGRDTRAVPVHSDPIVGCLTEETAIDPHRPRKVGVAVTLNLTKAEAAAVLRAELSVGHGVRRAQALVSAEAKLHRAIAAATHPPVTPPALTEVDTADGLAGAVAALAKQWTDHLARARKGRWSTPADERLGHAADELRALLTAWGYGEPGGEAEQGRP